MFFFSFLSWHIHLLSFIVYVSPFSLFFLFFSILTHPFLSLTLSIQLHSLPFRSLIYPFPLLSYLFLHFSLFFLFFINFSSSPSFFNPFNPSSFLAFSFPYISFSSHLMSTFLHFPFSFYFSSISIPPLLSLTLSIHVPFLPFLSLYIHFFCPFQF